MSLEKHRFKCKFQKKKKIINVFLGEEKANKTILPIGTFWYFFVEFTICDSLGGLLLLLSSENGCSFVDK